MSAALARDTASEPPRPLEALLDRFDPARFDVPAGRHRIRCVTDEGAWDVLLDQEAAIIDGPSTSRRADATLTAELPTWERLGRDVRGGLDAWRDGALHIDGNLHLAIGLIAATAAAREPGTLEVRCVRTAVGNLSAFVAGRGEPVLMLHGLGATKVSFLPTIAALAPGRRTIAVDLPGFGDSTKPIGAPYDPAYFARAAMALLDELGIRRAHVIGHSMGGRAALEVGLRYPERVGGLVLVTPSMAWLRARPWAPWLRLLRPELGLLQVAPRPVVEALVRRVVPNADAEWVSTGIDEFLRAYLDPRGRAAFYASARNIYLEEPLGPHGFWTRLPELKPPSLFIWGRYDRLVPPGFAHYVREALPQARHVTVTSAHVPQLERPAPTHAAIASFLEANPLRSPRQPAR